MEPKPGSVFPQLTPEEAAAIAQRQLVARLMRLVAINAHVAWMSGGLHPGSYYSNASKRSSEENLQPGDLVCEWSTLRQWARHADDTPRDEYPEIGILLRVSWEPHPGEHADPDAREKVWYIRPLDGHRDEVRWTNASFFRVLTAANLEEMARR